MAAISGIEATGAPHTVPSASHQQKGANAAIDFGGAVTHRELVLDELRVDPAALVQKKRAADPVIAQDPPAEDDESARAERFAQDDAARDAPPPAPSRKGQYVDVKV